jgi:hypothetical protein
LYRAAELTRERGKNFFFIVMASTTPSFLLPSEGAFFPEKEQEESGPSGGSAIIFDIKTFSSEKDATEDPLYADLAHHHIYSAEIVINRLEGFLVR